MLRYKVFLYTVVDIFPVNCNFFCKILMKSFNIFIGWFPNSFTVVFTALDTAHRMNDVSEFPDKG